MSSSNRDLSTCCTADLNTDVELDQVHENRPGLPELVYRLGHHGDFFTRMLGRLPNQHVAGENLAPLARLTYRGKDDATIALIDACSSLMEVLSFYQERIANETFIRTAIERRSVLELARALGYEMRPGVAASTLLAFTVDDSPGSPEQVMVPPGTQILSIPKKDELPQTFETIEPLEARAEWNAMDVRPEWQTLGQMIRSGGNVVFVHRSGPRLRRGDVVLLTGIAAQTVGDITQGSEVRAVRRVHEVTDFPEHGYRRVTLQPAASDGVLLDAPRLFAFSLRTTFFGQNAPNPDGRTIVTRRVFATSILTEVKSVALSPAGQWAASGFEAMPPASPEKQAEEEALRKTLRIWNIAAGREEKRLDVYDTITAVSFSTDDGMYIAATTHENSTIGLYVWNVASGTRVVSATSTAQSGPLEAIVFQAQPDGTYRITTINAASQAVVWTLDISTSSPSLTPSPTILDLGALGDITGDPRQVILAQRSLVGDDNGVTWYEAKEVFETVPEKIDLRSGKVDLNGIYNKVVPGSWVLLMDPNADTRRAYPIDSVTTAYRSDYGISKRITRIEVGSETESFSLRETDIYGESDEIELATVEVALPVPIEGDLIPLIEDAALPVGRTVIIQGRLAGAAEVTDGEWITAMRPDSNVVSLQVKEPGDVSVPWTVVDENGFGAALADNPPNLALWDDEASEVYEVAKVAMDPASRGTDPRLRLAEPLKNRYDWRTVKILANIAPATHGQTVVEVLGSGDGLARNQRFKLKKPPLTYISGMTGQETTLAVRVNNVLWKEERSLLDLTPQDESFIVRIEDDGTTHVTFGDSERGARLPSGLENVVATYRSGLGPEGEVEAGQLALLKTKPLGIREVVNPLPATGAAPPEHEAETRINAPLTVLVLGRVVSIQDYEDFAKTFPGVGKAQAVAMWDGYAKYVHLTIGTSSGDPIEYGSPFYESLRSALDNVRDTHQKMTIDGFVEKRFGVSAKIMIDERYLPDPVLAAIHERLVADFSYDMRGLGQAVTASELVASIHRVAGVIAVDIDALFLDGDRSGQDGSTAPVQKLPAKKAYQDGEGAPQLAELLLIAPAQITLEVMP